MSKSCIIIPAYKVEKYLNRCVDSVVTQTYSNFECMLVDDGSCDDSGKICDEYLLNDERFVVIHQKNGGLSSARNSGIDWSFACSDSDWLTFIDSDDIITSRYLEILLNAVKEGHTNISVAGMKNTTGTGDIDTNYYGLENLKPDIAYGELNKTLRDHEINLISACAKLYRKELFRDVRYPLGKLYEDRFTTYKLLFKNEELAIAKAIVYIYYQNPDSIMHYQWTPRALDDFEALEQQKKFFKQNMAKNAYKNTIDDYLVVLSRQIKQIRGGATQ